MQLPVAYLFGVLLLVLPAATLTASDSPVHVEIIEGIPHERSWDFDAPEPTNAFRSAALAWTELPQKYNAKALRADRSNPFLLRARVQIETPAGDARFLLRAKSAARLYCDGELLAETDFLDPNPDGHDDVPDRPESEEGLYPLAVGHQERIAPVSLTEGAHEIVVETIVGGKKIRAELGELVVGLAVGDGPFELVGATPRVALNEEGWEAYVRRHWEETFALNRERRRAASPAEDAYWRGRHEIARNVWSAGSPQPPDDERFENPIDRYIAAKSADGPADTVGVIDDWSFLRRATLDTVGVIPTLAEIEAFERDSAPGKRERAIDRLLADRRWADHWVAYWQDLLAENPGLVKPKLNNTGPFRWWVYESFLDNKPIDRFATELIMMEGSALGGGPAGFAMATQNDLPMAAKAHIIAKAFLAVEMKCARCHDAPMHDVVQEDTFQLAAMLRRDAVKVPETSTVPLEPGGRIPAVAISLKPGDEIAPDWPFEHLAPAEIPAGVLRREKDLRERAAAIVTSPHSRRFPRVIANRLWHRYLGWAIVEPVDDWEAAEASHPELLDYLSHELVTSGYDLKHVARLILTSETYQRHVEAGGVGGARPRSASKAYIGPVVRRLTAEQVVDSLATSVGKELCSDQLCLDPEGRRPITTFLNLGKPRRGWQMAPLSNERDRPALSLPAAQSVLDVLRPFGWRESRQDPLAVRDEEANVLQPLALAGGAFANRAACLCDESAITDLALQELPLERFVDRLFRTILTRPPTHEEIEMFGELLRDGYDSRRTGLTHTVGDRTKLHAVSWSNHLSPEATRIKLELEKAAARGAAPTERLSAPWRERAEDAVWALVNSPEFVFVP